MLSMGRGVVSPSPALSTCSPPGRRQVNTKADLPGLHREPASTWHSPQVALNLQERRVSPVD